MNIVLSGGGTAGHINPALALATELQSRGHAVFFAGTPEGVEARLVPQAGIPFTGFEAAGFNRNHPASIVRALRLMSASTKKAAAWFDQIKPDAVVCFGGYVCLPVGRAAEKRGIPVVVHEQNSVMGMANEYLARKAKKVALTYAVAGEKLSDRSRCVVTGNPVRASVYSATRSEGRAYLGIPDDALMLLVFGGSLGARHINTALAALKEDILARPRVRVVQISGPKEYDSVVELLALTPDQAARWQVKGYEDKMGCVLAAADCTVSRAGATSLAEISALGIPALLVPFPYATADHQTVNAREYVAAGAACMVADDRVEEEEFRRELLHILDDDDARRSMHEAAARFETRDAAAKLADVVAGAVSAS